MTLKERLLALDADIQSYEYSPNLDPYYPLPQKIKEVRGLVCFESPDERHNDYLNICVYKLLDGCERMLDGNTSNLDFRILSVKESVSAAIYDFIRACNEFGMAEHLEKKV